MRNTNALKNMENIVKAKVKMLVANKKKKSPPKLISDPIYSYSNCAKMAQCVAWHGAQRFLLSNWQCPSGQHARRAGLGKRSVRGLYSGRVMTWHSDVSKLEPTNLLLASAKICIKDSS